MGDMYVGEYKDDKRHGKGLYTMKDGTRYEGGFCNGRPHGHGTYGKDTAFQCLSLLLTARSLAQW